MIIPDANAAVEAFCRHLDGDGHEFKLERGQMGASLFQCDETINLDRALIAALRAVVARAEDCKRIRSELESWKVASDAAANPPKEGALFSENYIRPLALMVQAERERSASGREDGGP